MKILVIEDERTSLKLANLVLSSEGHEVTEAQSGEQAYQAVLDNQPHVILLDLELPGIDGLALAQQLKAAAATRHIPIVAVTGYPMQYPRDSALEAGCDAYIVKPIDTRKLSGQITEIVHKYGRT